MLSDKAKTEIRALQARYPVPRSALGPALYVAQREAGWLPASVLAEVAELFGLDVTEVGEFASFYHMYKTHEAPGQYHIELCTNVPCMLRGSGVLAERLKERLDIEFGERPRTTASSPWARSNAWARAPPRRCSCAPRRPRARSASSRSWTRPKKLEEAVTLIASGQGFDTCERWPLGPFRHGGKPETNFLLGRVDKPDSHKIDTYVADGGYETAKAVLTGGKTPQQVIDEMKAANVRGRGGAGFPAGQKWSFLPAGKYPRYLVVNADESEPGTFKDRMIMEYDPHQLVEGIILACYAIEAERAFIYVRGEYYFAAERLDGAIAEAEARGFLGDNVFGTGKKLKVVVHRGAGAYECGEETAQLTSLEGYRGHPRLKPPFPAVEGLYAKPTIVNNVETIANVPHVLRHGADWYKQWGTPQSTGFRVFCLSGQVKYPGLYELPHGTSLRELIYDFGGGLTEEAGELKAVIPGGLSVQLLDPSQLDTPLDYENLAKQGSALGSAAVIVIGANQSLVEVARRTLAFYREESCGKCTPCREGTPWLEAILERIEHGEGRVEDIALMTYIADMIGGKSFCPFGYAAVWGLQSNLAKFRPEFDAAIAAATEFRSSRCARPTGPTPVCRPA